MREFVNTDEIARGLWPFNPSGGAIESGRWMLQRIEELLVQEVSFSIETTLATRSYINLVRKAQAKGYRVSMLFHPRGRVIPYNSKTISEQEIKEFEEKLSYGLQLAEKRMLQEKALHGECVIVQNDDGVI